MQRFRTARGRLTHYALACGYIETREVNGVSVTLWHEGGPCLHVRAHGPQGRIFWDSFPTLTEARKRFDKAVRELRA